MVASGVEDATVQDGAAEETAPDVRQGAPLTVGEHFGRFVISGVLGRGGWGTVYRAQDTELGRLVAIKVMSPARPTADATRALAARLKTEARAMAQLSHPNVVALHDVGTVDERAFVVMELVNGANLRQWLAETERNWRDVLRLFADAGRGLSAAHAVGLAHRDFKPENVLVGHDGRTRVTDFGLASSFDELDVAVAAAPGPTVALAGTPAYMAPEQILGKPTDARTDQFSFCISLFIALHSVHPFLGRPHRGADMNEVLRAILLGIVHEPSASAVPRAVNQALQRGLSPNPEDRFPSLDQLLEVLDQERATSEESPGRSVFGVAAVSATIAGLLGAGIWLGVFRDQEGASRLDRAEWRVTVPRALLASTLEAASGEAPRTPSAQQTAAAPATADTPSRAATAKPAKKKSAAVQPVSAAPPPRRSAPSASAAPLSGNALLNPFKRGSSKVAER